MESEFLRFHLLVEYLALIVIFFGLGEDLDKLAFSYWYTGTYYVSVSVFGDQDKPALITYPDLALN